MLRNTLRGCLPAALIVAAIAVICPFTAFAAAESAPVPLPAATLENGWEAVIANHDLIPQSLVAVDKQRQLLFLFERRSPLRMVEQYTCTTGKIPGDKLIRGDLKTPEGIYFVERHLESGLDYLKYGNEAYTLNYPNPVDRLRRKTGYGIWIHGRGTPIEPRITEGCVALNNGDVTILGSELWPGSPVALASGIIQAEAYPQDQSKIITLLEERSYAWAAAWSARSATLFDFYDQEAYSLAQGEPFSRFRAQKERLFKILPWINTKISLVQVLQGPGYWVSWFEQDYNAPNLSSKGIRRLYWQEYENGELRIVGMEWLPQLSGTLLASAGREIPRTAAPETPETSAPAASPASVPVVEAEPEPTPVETAISPAEELAAEASIFVEKWRRAWENGDLAAYLEHYDPDAGQDVRQGRAAIEAHKLLIWKKTPPVRVTLSNVRIKVNGDLVTADMLQEYTDAGGYADMGIKTLTIRRSGSSLRIIREEWSREIP